MHVVYTGERVRLRPFRDLDEYMQLQGQRDLHMNAFWGPWHSSEPALRRAFEADGLLGGDEACHAIEDLSDGAVAGVALHGTPAGGELSCWLATFVLESRWGRGLGREAKLLKLCHLFENYSVQSVWAGTTGEHEPASRGLLACGFRLAGGLRHYHWHGKYVDILDYQLMRSDWEAMPIRQTVRRGN
ncbi:GNAT family N-acetyltransferase [bacterium]|nr:GNAT family N-acetyltransferase [bacterium]